MMADKKVMTTKAFLLVSVLAFSGFAASAIAQDAGFQPALPGMESAAPAGEVNGETSQQDNAQEQIPSLPAPEPAPAAEAPATNLSIPETPVLPGAPAVPQTASNAAIPVEAATLVAIAEAKSHVHDASVTPEAIKSLFYTAWQHALLQEAKIGFNTRLPNPGEMAVGESGARDPGIREISLGGIAFANGKKWTVWLNGVRITPDAIPEQVLDIKVSDAYIDLKWFDGYTNKIYPIRLRPHERFNLDTRIFLPGTGTL